MTIKDKQIYLSGHAQAQMSKRGYNFEEVEETILNTHWNPAELGRLECSKDFPYN